MKKNSALNDVVFCLLFFCTQSFSMEEKSNKDIQLILLNGASCAGKTSLAKKLVDLAQTYQVDNVCHMSFDTIFVNDDLNPNYIEEQKKEFEGKGVIFFADPSMNVAQQRMECYFTIFYYQILEKMEQGNRVIADHCFSTEEGFLDFLHIFRDKCSHIALIKIFCSYEVAKERFMKRNAANDITQKRLLCFFKQHYDRSKKGKYSTIYDNKVYDEEIDTSGITPEEGAEYLLPWLFGHNAIVSACTKNQSKYSSELVKRFGSDSYRK